MKLAIVSHTRHYYDPDGNEYGWGPTIREINFLAGHFDEIIHAACLHSGNPPASAIPYSSRNIRFIALPPSGGLGARGKLSVLTHARTVIDRVKPLLGEADAIQLRVPTGMANYLLPWFALQQKRPLLWVKYAGNWDQRNAPTGYRFQRWFLARNFLKSMVTINGRWPKQPAHCRSFENPCIDHAERMVGHNALQTKSYAGANTGCFVGRIEEEKGVGRLIEALPMLGRRGIKTMHFIGEGQGREQYARAAAAQKEVRCHFHGPVARTRIPEFLGSAHFLFLPSIASEGFPKVVAEGANYGAIPVVSAISSIGQYINDGNGYLWDPQTPFSEWFESLDLNPALLASKARAAYDVAEAFTFEHYLARLRTEILNDFKPGTPQA